jgi:hypothetical protein
MSINRINQLAGMTITRANLSGTNKTFIKWVPAGPKTKPPVSKDQQSRYLDSFIEVIADMIYVDRFSLKEIANVLNMSGLKTSRNKDWTAGYVDSAIRHENGWKIIEPRWNQWLAENPDYVIGRNRGPKTKIKPVTNDLGHSDDCVFCSLKVN